MGKSRYHHPKWRAPQRHAAGQTRMTSKATTVLKQVLFHSSFAPVDPRRREQQAAARDSAHYVGSPSCRKCHAQIYERCGNANGQCCSRPSPNFLMPSSQIFPPTPFRFTRDRSPSSTAAFGSNVTSRKGETTIFRNRLSGMSPTAFGGRVFRRSTMGRI